MGHEGTLLLSTHSKDIASSSVRPGGDCLGLLSSTK